MPELDLEQVHTELLDPDCHLCIKAVQRAALLSRMPMISSIHKMDRQNRRAATSAVSRASATAGLTSFAAFVFAACAAASSF